MKNPLGMKISLSIKDTSFLKKSFSYSLYFMPDNIIHIRQVNNQFLHEYFTVSHPQTYNKYIGKTKK